MDWKGSRLQGSEGFRFMEHAPILRTMKRVRGPVNFNRGTILAYFGQNYRNGAI